MDQRSDLVLDHLSKTFNSIIAANDISLTVKQGELLVLLGPSGSGKSTLLRLVAGLETPDMGIIRFGNSDFGSLPPRQRNVAMVFQNFAVYPHMTVYENIAYPLRVQRSKEPEIKRAIQQVAQLLSIDHLLDRQAAKLSGGEAQRVALARALVRNPTLLLLDEPFSNLEASLRERLRLEVRSIQRRLKITTIFVTHDQEEAASLADRIALLRGGVLQQVDTLGKVVKEPANRFVASFMSRPILNILEGRVAYNVKVPFFVSDCGSIKVNCARYGGDLIDLEKVALGVRPDELSMSKTPTEGAVSVVVDQVVPGLTATTIHARSPGGSSLVLRASLTKDLQGISSGSPLWIKFDESKCFIFRGEERVRPAES